MKTGNPNGEDADGTPMPEWKPYGEYGLNEMTFVSEGAVPAVEESAFKQFMIKQIQKELAE
jgi:para-nitrobenzyl esterase